MAIGNRYTLPFNLGSTGTFIDPRSQVPRSAGGAPPPPPPPKKKSLEEIWAEDPYLQSLLARYAGESQADAISKNRAIQRALVEFGYLPQGLLEGLGIASQAELDAILDPTTKALIDKSTSSGLSVWARLQDTAKINQRDMLNSVAARVMYRSGETGYGLQRTALAAKQAEADAIKQVTDYLAGVQQAFTAAERARLDAIDAARRQSITDYVPGEDPVPHDPSKPYLPPGGVGGFKFTPGVAPEGVTASQGTKAQGWGLPPPGTEQSGWPGISKPNYKVTPQRSWLKNRQLAGRM